VCSSVKIPVVERKKTKSIQYSKWLLWVSLSVLAIGLFINNNLAALSSGIIVILNIIFLSFSKKHYVNGVIIFNGNYIKLILSENEQVFDLKSLSDIKVKYDGYNGESYPNPKSILPKNGTGNFIVFLCDGKKFSYELLLERKNLNPLNNIFNQWKKNNIELALTGEWGWKVKSI